MSRPIATQLLAGRESVWDYPRPPRLEICTARLRVIFGGQTIADTTAGYRVLETSHPPVYYISPDDVSHACRGSALRGSFCEFKGAAEYWSLHIGDRSADNAAWSYPNPTPAYAPIAGYLAFYASRVDECWVDDERVRPQPGDFYGGWITSRVVGPFKGGAGTLGW